MTGYISDFRGNYKDRGVLGQHIACDGRVRLYLEMTKAELVDLHNDFIECIVGRSKTDQYNDLAGNLTASEGNSMQEAIMSHWSAVYDSMDKDKQGKLKLRTVEFILAYLAAKQYNIYLQHSELRIAQDN